MLRHQPIRIDSQEHSLVWSFGTESVIVFIVKDVILDGNIRRRWRQLVVPGIVICDRISEEGKEWTIFNTLTDFHPRGRCWSRTRHQRVSSHRVWMREGSMMRIVSTMLVGQVCMGVLVMCVVGGRGRCHLLLWMKKLHCWWWWWWKSRFSITRIWWGFRGIQGHHYRCCCCYRGDESEWEYRSSSRGVSSAQGRAWR